MLLSLHTRATQSDRHPPGRLFSGRGIRAPSRKCAGPSTPIIYGFEPGRCGVRIRTLKRVYTGQCFFLLFSLGTFFLNRRFAAKKRPKKISPLRGDFNKKYLKYDCYTKYYVNRLFCPLARRRRENLGVLFVTF